MMQGARHNLEPNEGPSPSSAIGRLLRSASAGSKIISRVEERTAGARKAVTSQLLQLIDGVESFQVSGFEGIAISDFLDRAAGDDVVVAVQVRGDELAACCAISAVVLSRLTDLVFGGTGEVADDGNHAPADGPAPFAGAADQGVADAISRLLTCELVTAISGHCVELTADGAKWRVMPLADALRKLADTDGVYMKVAWRTASQSFQARVFLAEDVCRGDNDDKPRQNDPTLSISMLNKLRKTQLNLEILLGQRELSLAEISTLKTGDVIALDLWLGGEVSVACESMPLMWANFDQDRDQFVLRVTRFANPGKEADS